MISDRRRRWPGPRCRPPRRPRRLRKPWSALALSIVVATACGSSASTAPAPTPAPATPTLPAVLPAGTYTSTAFKPPATITLPDGWWIAADTVDYFGLQPVSSDALGIHLFRSPRAASQDLDCPLTAAAGVGTAAKDLVDWIRARPGFTAGDPVPVTVGGFAGLQVDLGIVDGWKASCPFANGAPTVPLFVGATDASFRWVVAGSERLRVDILDVPGSGTVVVDIDSFDGSLMDGFLPAAASIVESLRFGLP